MIIQDVKRILELREQIHALDEAMAELADQSELACRIGSVQGFGKTCVAELAGEIGTTERFRCVPQSRAYYDKKRAEGKTHNQAVRSLGRHLVRVIWPACANGRQVNGQERKGLRTLGGAP